MTRKLSHATGPQLTNGESIIEAAGFLIFTRQTPSKFLLMQHKSRWDLPKGHVDNGETLLEAALRETEEETGIPRDTIDIDPDFHFSFEYEVQTKKRGRKRKRSTYFLGHIAEAVDIKLTEHIGFCWKSWPPGLIQAETIDPLLAAVATHLDNRQINL